MNSWSWSPDLLQFTADPGDTVRSTSWHVIQVCFIISITSFKVIHRLKLPFLSQLFASYEITHTLPQTESFGPRYYVSGLNQNTGTHIFKAAVYNSTGDYPVSVTFDGVEKGTSATLTYLVANDPYAYNAAGQPEVVQTKNSQIIASEDGEFAFTLPNLSVAVLETGH